MMISNCVLKYTSFPQYSLNGAPHTAVAHIGEEVHTDPVRPPRKFHND